MLFLDESDIHVNGKSAFVAEGRFSPTSHHPPGTLPATSRREMAQVHEPEEQPPPNFEACKLQQSSFVARAGRVRRVERARKWGSPASNGLIRRIGWHEALGPDPAEVLPGSVEPAALRPPRPGVRLRWRAADSTHPTKAGEDRVREPGGQTTRATRSIRRPCNPPALSLRPVDNLREGTTRWYGRPIPRARPARPRGGGLPGASSPCVSSRNRGSPRPLGRLRLP